MIDLFGDEAYTDQLGIIPSPLNYTGSKFKLFSLIREYFPKSCNTFWDLFCGGGSVFINSVFDKIVANDIITPLIEFYIFLQSNSWDKVIMAIEERKIPKDDQDAYIELRKRFNQSKDCIDFFMLVCCCTNNMIRFNQKKEFNQTWGQRTFNSSTEARLRAFHGRLYGNSKISFLNSDFRKCQVGQGDFVYLDPPYGISDAGYNTYWSEDDELALYEYLDVLNACEISFMLSNVAEHKGKINQHLDKLSKYKIIELPFDYNKVSRSGLSKTKEIIVINY